ncbi:SDR family NAD(P)-dependent oxidoreductase [Clostridium hydrogenum]|uniref:SDR family NAD(P)-dependent oxidoreductase n=1 Tax=Clostridium hydrogenum TaxID=2855764 RepID=UPI001F352BD0|nr:SDR family oxidoreductase [Clostridium hydrogenum]
MKETVLITGASSGIGYELARVFASHKYNLILVARSAKKLNELAELLRNQYDVKVDVMAHDLSQVGASKKLFDEVKSLQITVDVLVNNAGVGNVGFFHETELNKDAEMIQLNITALTEMTKLFSREMVKRKKGKILNVGSTGSFAPGPYIAVYYATKAYVLSFSKAIAKELKAYGVTVTALCPGAVKTNFCKTAGKRDVPGAMEASVVAKLAYEGLLKNKEVIVPGVQNKILIRLPKGLVSSINFKNQQKLSLKNH